MLFIDARQMGFMLDRTLRDLSDEDVQRIAETYDTTYDTWKADADYEDVAGFCKSATQEEIAQQGYVLTPGRCVGAGAVEEDDEPFAEKMARLTATLKQQFAESSRLEAIVKQNLGKLGYDEYVVNKP